MKAKDNDSTPKRRDDGKWRKGKSGNPGGRPKGAINRDTLRETLADELPGVLNKIVEAALEGDIAAAKLLLDRVVPPLKPVEVRRPVKGLDGPLVRVASRILGALEAGELGVQEGASLLSAAVSAGRLAELEALGGRIEVLERVASGDNR